MKRTFFVPGLWFDSDGPIGKDLKQRFSVLDQRNIPSIDARADSLLTSLTPEVNTLIGHNAGCTVIAEALKKLPQDHSLKQIIFLNPAPARGVTFRPWDRIFWIIANPKYISLMLFCKSFLLSRKDFTKLLSLRVGEIDETLKNLAPDSGTFVRDLVLYQYRKQEPLTIPPEIRFTIVNSPGDKMVGSTEYKTERLYIPPHAKREHICGPIHTAGHGHIWTIQNIATTLLLLRNEGFEF